MFRFLRRRPTEPPPGLTWEQLARDAYIREPDYRIAAMMVYGLMQLSGATQGSCGADPNHEGYKAIAFAGLKSRLIAKPPTE